MSRVFWMAVGAVGGVAAYRKGTRAVHRARELGPLGTAQVAAATTSKLAGRTAHGLGRLQDIKAQREGRLVLGSAETVAPVSHPTPVADAEEWAPVPSRRAPAAGAAPVAPTIAPPRAAPTGAPSATAPRPPAASRTTRTRRG
jgi:hypothetical protein